MLIFGRKNVSVSVLTVDDGLVFSFTRDKLNHMIETLGEENVLTVFVKSSALLPKN